VLESGPASSAESSAGVLLPLSKWLPLGSAAETALGSGVLVTPPIEGSGVPPPPPVSVGIASRVGGAGRLSRVENRVALGFLVWW
jgi:hypothetical protein